MHVPDPVRAPQPGLHFALASGNEVGEHVAPAAGLRKRERVVEEGNEVPRDIFSSMVPRHATYPAYPASVSGSVLRRGAVAQGRDDLGSGLPDFHHL